MHAQRWDYKVIDIKAGFLFKELQAENLTESLNREGLQGWELVNVVAVAGTMKAFFKRER